MTRWSTALRLLIAIAAATAALGAAAAHAATSTVTFDDQSNGTLIGNQYAATNGVTFMDPPRDTVRVTDAPGFAHSGNEVAAVERTCMCEDFSPYDARVNLSTTASSVSAWVGYFGPEAGSTGMQLVAYDATDTQVAASPVATVVQGSPMQQITVTSATANIAHVEIVQVLSEHEANDKMVVDDFAVTTPDTAAPADFSLSNGLGVLDVLQGQSLSDPITINRLNGSNGDIAMSVTGLPAGMTGSFSPNPVPGTSNTTQLTVSAAPLSVATTDYSNVTITGTPSSSAAGPAPRTATAIARISENCTHHVSFDYVDLRDTGCLSKSGNTAWQAINTEVHVDGLVLTPRDRDSNGDAVLTVDSAAKTIKSETTSTWSVTLQGYPNVPIYYGPIRWSFKDDYTGPVPLDQNPIGKPKEIEGIDIKGTPILQGIPITGIKAVLTTKDQAIVTPTFTLDFFPLNYFGAVSVSGSFTTDNDHGVNFSGLEFKIPKADILGLELRDVDVKYVDSGTFSGEAKVVLKFDDDLEVGAGYGIKNGNFDFLKGSVGNINTPIGAGIYLQGIGFELHTNPAKLIGQITLSAGPKVLGKTALSVTGGVTVVLADPWIVEVDGDAKIADKYKLASAFVRYTSFGLFEFGGNVHASIDPIYVDGSVNGWVAGLSNFDVEGAVHGCIDVPLLPDPCAGAKLLISSIGVAGCVEALGYGVGAGYTWGGSADAFTGCDLSPWRPVEPTGGARAATATALTHVDVPAGLPAVAWQLRGAGGAAPDVTVSGPGGALTKVTSQDPYVHDGGLTAFKSVDGSTYITVVKPAAGAWTIANASNIPITGVRQAVGLPRPSVSASVSGTGRKRVLRWHLKPINGQLVTFAEIGKDSRHVIVKTRKARGAVAFAPGAGSAGTRKIEAIVEQDRHPRTTLTVAHYRAPGMRKPVKVRGLKITRRSTTLTVSWRPTSGGFRHAVYLAVGDRRRLLSIVAGSKRKVTFSGIATNLSATATVTGLTRLNAKGPAAKAAIKPAKRKHKPSKK